MSHGTDNSVVLAVLEMLRFEARAGRVVRIELSSIDGRTRVLAYIDGLQPEPQSENPPEDAAPGGFSD